MADDIETFVKYGNLKTKITLRRVLWFVQNFSDVCNERKGIRSDLFMVSTSPYCVFYLAMIARATDLTIFLNRCASNTSKDMSSGYTANIAISFEDEINNLHLTKESTMSKDTTLISSSYNQSVIRNILVRGSLKVHCSVALEEIGSTQTVREHISENCFSSFSANELKEHIDVLLDGDASNKVIISVDGEEFSVHKTLLCSHSPVFSAMFSHETIENQQNQVFIDDVSKEVFGEILKYIYTGCTSVLLPWMAIKLYIASDKYALFDLKDRCSKLLVSSLNQELVLDILVFSHQYADVDLKTAAMRFLIDKASNVLESPDFLLFIKEESEIIQSILLTLLKHVK